MSKEVDIPEELLSPYDSANVEQDIYRRWEESRLFNPDECIAQGHTLADAPHFSLVLPPPNVTGILHTGHSLMLTIEDIAVRYNRMLGKRTLWIPGTDHAAIATESKVAKMLEKEGKRKHEMGRDAFIAEVEQFAQESQNTIVSQVKRMGASLDWSRLAYTLDEKRKKAVYTAFERLYDMGLIYRGHRIVSWDPKGQTVISNDEVVYEEETTSFYYFKYGPFTIGTSRPETKFGDKYVVMHPDDDRYKEYAHGQTIDLEWINGPIEATVIKDESVDPTFGSGVMTITPWHSQVDFEIAERHNLDKEQIIDQRGRLLPIAGEFEGMKIAEARAKIVEKLKEKGLLVDIEQGYVHQLATAERTNGIIEPQIMEQWFIDVDKEFTLPHSEIEGIKSGSTVTLKQLMQHVVQEGHVSVLPERFVKTYFHWIDNLRNWCISRQIWFGHRIPVWYKDGEMKVSEVSPGDGWEQDPDTLDTWFSSGLWTFSTLGWPEETDDLATYHPTTLIETGPDILFFWIARMVLMSTTLRGQIPFQTVYLHGMVRDEKGRKISKSLGNNIDPVDIIETHGADALRMAQIVAVGPGNDNNLGENKIRAYRKFSNKLWNVARFVVSHTQNEHDALKEAPLHEKHSTYIHDLEKVVASTNEHMEEYRYYLASEELYHFIWHQFADVVIEALKADLASDDSTLVQSARRVLVGYFATTLTLLHPFMPFITEKLWEYVPDYKKKNTGTLLMIQPWPKHTSLPSS